MSLRSAPPSESPYLILGLPQDADEAAIRAAYHALVRSGRVDGRINAAYASIRDAQGRERTCWSTFSGIAAALPAAPPPGQLLPADLEALIRELAFLSDWELGADDA